jgi:hypothetical protein
MMKALTICAITFVLPASAEEMSPVGCNALSESAASAADRLEETLLTMKGDAFRAAMAVMPDSAKDEAGDLDDARIGAESALRVYKASLEAFAKAIKDCGN